MTFGTPASGSDRLPWLPDERRAPRIGASAIMLAFAVWIAVVAAAISYSPWKISFDAFDNFKPRSRATRSVPAPLPAARAPEVYGNLQVLPAPDSSADPAATASPGPASVAPAPPTHAAGPRLPPVDSPISPGPAASTAAPSETVKAASPTAKTTTTAADNTGVECRLAKTRAALALCSNRSLATLDREHALIYNQSWRYADAAKRTQLQRARQKMASSLSACQNDTCISGTYLTAMREVSGIMSAKAAPSPARPSFSCRGVRKPGQIAVCSDPNLAALDRQQALLYRQSWGLADGAKRAQLMRAQRRMASTRDKCGSEQCAKNAYLAAMKEVAEIMTKN